MASRKPISKKRRFDVFKRDGFTCQYCGATPPSVLLHVDHIVPVKEGGGNEETNLVTACQNCNLGKAAESLTVIPESLASRAAQVSEREAQLTGYSKIMAKQRERIDAESWDVADLFIDQFMLEGIRKDWFQSIRSFVERIGAHDCIRAMEIATAKKPLSRSQCFSYFCGICWNIVREAK